MRRLHPCEEYNDTAVTETLPADPGQSGSNWAAGADRPGRLTVCQEPGPSVFGVAAANSAARWATVAQSSLRSSLPA